MPSLTSSFIGHISSCWLGEKVCLTSGRVDRDDDFCGIFPDNLLSAFTICDIARVFLGANVLLLSTPLKKAHKTILMLTTE